MINEVVNKSIYDKIIDKGSLDASEIIGQGKKRANEIKENIIDEASNEASKLIENNNRINQDKIKASTTGFERLTKKEILFKKKELIDELFVIALDKLKNLKDDDFFKLVKKYILEQSISGNEVLKVNKSDYGKFLSLFSSSTPANLVSLNKLNATLGENYNLKLSNVAVNIDGGFIIISEHFDIDLSFNSILNIIKEEKETEIANILYNEEN